MLGYIIIAIIVLVVLYKKGVFKKTCNCQKCGVTLKGTEQISFGVENPFILCKDCANKIHPQIKNYAIGNWSYNDYTDYLAWEEETKEEREKFKPEYTYGYGSKLKIDPEQGLFCIDSGKKSGLVFRFRDLQDYQLDFKGEEIKEGMFNDRVKGKEFIMVELLRPAVLLEEVLNYGASYNLRKKGIISTKYEYDLSEDFLKIIRAFTVSLYIEQNKRDSAYNEANEEQNVNVSELGKALALFMFDSMDDVTEDNLKKQRNALIKAFHPDNNVDSEVYSQKINAAYELLSKTIAK